MGNSSIFWFSQSALRLTKINHTMYGYIINESFFDAYYVILMQR
jgi:hypothetical protein